MEGRADPLRRALSRWQRGGLTLRESGQPRQGIPSTCPLAKRMPWTHALKKAVNSLAGWR